MKVAIQTTNAKVIKDLIREIDNSGVIEFAQANTGPEVSVSAQGPELSLYLFGKMTDNIYKIKGYAAITGGTNTISIHYRPTGGNSTAQIIIEVGPSGPTSMIAKFDGARGSIYNSGVGQFFWPLQRAIKAGTARLISYKTTQPERAFDESKLAFMARKEGESLPVVLEECRKAFAGLKSWKAVYAFFSEKLIDAVRRQYQY